MTRVSRRRSNRFASPLVAAVAIGGFLAPISGCGTAGRDAADGGVDLAGVVCVVDATRQANPAFSTAYREGRIFFGSEENLAAYSANPAEYVSEANFQIVRTGQYEQHACPLSGEPFDEEFGVVRVGGLDIQVMCPDCVADVTERSTADQIEYLFDDEGFEFGKFTAKPIGQ